MCCSLNSANSSKLSFDEEVRELYNKRCFCEISFEVAKDVSTKQAFISTNTKNYLVNGQKISVLSSTTFDKGHCPFFLGKEGNFLGFDVSTTKVNDLMLALTITQSTEHLLHKIGNTNGYSKFQEIVNLKFEIHDEIHVKKGKRIINWIKGGEWVEWIPVSLNDSKQKELSESQKEYLLKKIKSWEPALNNKLQMEIEESVKVNLSRLTHIKTFEDIIGRKLNLIFRNNNIGLIEIPKPRGYGFSQNDILEVDAKPLILNTNGIADKQNKIFCVSWKYPGSLIKDFTEDWLIGFIMTVFSRTFNKLTRQLGVNIDIVKEENEKENQEKIDRENEVLSTADLSHQHMQIVVNPPGETEVETYFV